MDHFEYTSDFSLSTDTSIMLFGPVLKELQAPWGIPTLDGEHSHRAGIPKNLVGNNYIFEMFCRFGVHFGIAFQGWECFCL